MTRLLWLVAGCIVTYVASGYVEGLRADENNTQSEDNKTAGGE